MSGLNISSKLLYHRHRLSWQQIGELLGDKEHAPTYEEKVCQLGLVARFIEIAGELQAASIWFVPVKGPMLSWRIYDDPTSRRCRDFDFLIRPADLPSAFQLLRQMGYHPLTVEWPESPRLQKMVLSALNQFDFYHPDNGCTIELHWRLFKYPVTHPTNIENAIRDHIRQVSFAGRQFLQFTPEFELLYLCIHGGLHGWRRLKWLVDVSEFLKRNPVGKEQFEPLVRQFQAMRMAGLCNAMLRHFFPDGPCLPVSHQIPDWAFRHALALATRESDVHSSGLAGFPDTVLYRLWIFPSCRYKWKRLMGYFEFAPKDLKYKLIPPFPIFFTLFRIVRGLAECAANWLNRILNQKTTQYALRKEIHQKQRNHLRTAPR